MSSTKFVFFGPIGKTRWPPWSLIGWDFFDFSSETAERNSMKLDRKQYLNVLYQVCVFGPNGKTRWPPWPLIGWDIFDFSSETAERNSMKLDRKQYLYDLYQVCVFLGWSEKQDGCRGLWMAETFSTFHLKPLKGIQWNFTGSKNSTSSTEFVFFGRIGKRRWPPWPLIGWDIFDFSSETAEWNSMKLDREQDLNVLYQVCIFRADRKNKMAALASDWLRYFRLLLWNRWMEFNETWQEARSQCPLPSLCFWADRKNKMAALASDWLRHLRLLWNGWTEFNLTWQEARSQCPLPSLCFSSRPENKNGRPGWFLKKVAHCTQVHDMWPFGPLVRNWGIKWQVIANLANSMFM